MLIQISYHGQVEDASQAQYRQRQCGDMSNATDITVLQYPWGCPHVTALPLFSGKMPPSEHGPATPPSHARLPQASLLSPTSYGVPSGQMHSPPHAPPPAQKLGMSLGSSHRPLAVHDTEFATLHRSSQTHLPAQQCGCSVGYSLIAAQLWCRAPTLLHRGNNCPHG